MYNAYLGATTTIPADRVAVRQILRGCHAPQEVPHHRGWADLPDQPGRPTASTARRITDILGTPDARPGPGDEGGDSELAA
jgi:hypothetical protein